MKCPLCGEPTKVSNTSVINTGLTVKRFRKCTECYYVGYTEERYTTLTNINLDKYYTTKASLLEFSNYFNLDYTKVKQLSEIYSKKEILEILK